MMFPANRTPRRDAGFAARLRDALEGREKIWLARMTGYSTSTVGDYTAGVMPSAERAFKIAEVLGVDPQWLVTGVYGRPTLEEGWRLVPYHSLTELKERGFSDTAPQVPLKSEWLVQTYGSSRDIWITDMPSSAWPQLAAEGAPIVCRHVQSLSDGGLYLIELRGLFTVRRTELRADGAVLLGASPSDDPMDAPSVDARVPPCITGRVLGPLLAKTL
ncbi:MAG TPA: helix-turn-helix domain-containing protein [Caulobacteraceae bacterium]|jgi:hypothetical protein|nr:helix-turn-helix domain-containing protein [Caulobacteraceae bacterium]